VDEKEPVASTPFAKSMVGQTLCATVAGCCQVYSGGIVIDTVATRLQAGMAFPQAIYRVGRPQTDPHKLMRRFAAVEGMFRLEVQARALLRSNLFAGHFVTMLSRLPYLALNLNAYEQTENLLIEHGERQGDPSAPRPWTDEVICVASATLLSSTAITAAECPKILDQVKAPGEACKGPETIQGVYKRHGVARLMQGYTACFCRELLFNTALLVSPNVARWVESSYIQPNLESSSFCRAVHGYENFAISFGMGIGLGFITNGPDQLKTLIQAGKFKNMREAWAWQRVHGGGLRGLYGIAAIYRALFIAQAILTINFARGGVEQFLS